MATHKVEVKGSATGMVPADGTTFGYESIQSWDGVSDEFVSVLSDALGDFMKHVESETKKPKKDSDAVSAVVSFAVDGKDVAPPVTLAVCYQQWADLTRDWFRECADFVSRVSKLAKHGP